jgi:hypothetical protein
MELENEVERLRRRTEQLELELRRLRRRRPVALGPSSAAVEIVPLRALVSFPWDGGKRALSTERQRRRQTDDDMRT